MLRISNASNVLCKQPFQRRIAQEIKDFADFAPFYILLLDAVSPEPSHPRAHALAAKRARQLWGQQTVCLDWLS